MTRDRANEILFLWKIGAEFFSSTVITKALYITGDIDGPDSEERPRLVPFSRLPAWLEGPSDSFGAGAGEGAPIGVLSAAAVAAIRNGEAR